MKFNLVEEDKVLVKSAIEKILNKHNFTVADRYMAGPGLGGFKQMQNRLFLAFPDIHGTVEHMLTEDNLVVVYFNWTGIHKEVFQGIPPTDKPINIRSADLYRIENGKIVEHSDVVDYSNL